MELEERDGVLYYAGTDTAPDFTNPYWRISGVLKSPWYLNLR